MSRRKEHKMSVHHLVPKVRGGLDEDENLLRIWREKHDAWNKLFGEMTLSEIIYVLSRIERRRGNVFI